MGAVTYPRTRTRRPRPTLCWAHSPPARRSSIERALATPSGEAHFAFPGTEISGHGFGFALAEDDSNARKHRLTMRAMQVVGPGCNEDSLV